MFSATFTSTGRKHLANDTRPFIFHKNLFIFHKNLRRGFYIFITKLAGVLWNSGLHPEHSRRPSLSWADLPRRSTPLQRLVKDRRAANPCFWTGFLRKWREREVGGGIGMGNTCKPMAVSFQCMTKFTTKKKKKKESLKKKKKKRKWRFWSMPLRMGRDGESWRREGHRWHLCAPSPGGQGPLSTIAGSSPAWSLSMPLVHLSKAKKSQGHGGKDSAQSNEQRLSGPYCWHVL